MLLLLPLGLGNVYIYLGVCEEKNTARAQSMKGKGRISLLLLYFGACLNNSPQCYVAFAVLCFIDSTPCAPTDCRMAPAPTHETPEARWDLCSHQGLGSQNQSYNYYNQLHNHNNN